MKSRLVGLSLGTVILLSFGCGGTGVTGVTNSLYQGSWSGTWNSLDRDDNGTISLKVNPDGSYTGSIAGKTTSGTLSGNLGKFGNLVGTATFTASPNWTMNGGVSRSTTKLLGNFKFTVGGVDYAGAFTTDAGASSSP